MGCLYQIKFESSGKSYIGVTSKDPVERFNQHCQASRTHGQVIHKAMRKYGIQDCSMVILLIADCDEYLKKMEILAIKRFNTKTPGGYNMTDGGNGVINLSSEGMKRKVASFKKFAASKRGKKILSDAQTKAWSDTEKKKVRSEMVKQLWEDDKYRQHMSDVHKGQTLTEVQKEKILKKIKIYWSNPLNRIKRSKQSKEMWKDPEFIRVRALAMQGAKVKIGKASKEAWAKDGYREMMSSVHKQTQNTPEYKAGARKRTLEQMKDPEVKIQIANTLSKYKDCKFKCLIKDMPDIIGNKELLRNGFRTRQVDKFLRVGKLELVNAS